MRRRPNKTHAARFPTASKTFHRKCVSRESKQRFKLQGKDTSIQEKLAMLISILDKKNTNQECFIGIKSPCS